MILFLIVILTHSRGFVQIELIGTLTLTVYQKTHDLQWSLKFSYRGSFRSEQLTKKQSQIRAVE